MKAGDVRLDRGGRELTVYVAALTRRRSRMLQELLLSWSMMAIPERCRVTCLIVENDTSEISKPILDELRPRFGHAELLYVLEPNLGIPFGRNRAAREAIAGKADLLLFVDDDEVVAEDWLVRMIAGYRNSRARLMGAPLRARVPTEPLSYLQRKMFSNIDFRYRYKENRAKKRADLNSTNRVTVVTNNWLAETSVFTDHDIWFDESMRFTGGTDAKFYAEACMAGIATGWVADAFVYETISPDRLSFKYQYQRARDQSNTHMSRKKLPWHSAALQAVLGSAVKMAPCALLFIAIPLTGGKTTLNAARTLGWIAGRLGYVFGTKSSLYFDVTGN